MYIFWLKVDLPIVHRIMCLSGMVNVSGFISFLVLSLVSHPLDPWSSRSPDPKSQECISAKCKGGFIFCTKDAEADND